MDESEIGGYIIKNLRVLQKLNSKVKNLEQEKIVLENDYFDL